MQEQLDEVTASPQGDCRKQRYRGPARISIKDEKAIPKNCPTAMLLLATTFLLVLIFRGRGDVVERARSFPKFRARRLRQRHHGWSTARGRAL